MTEVDPLQQVRDRAADYQAQRDSPDENDKAEALAASAVRAAARHAVDRGEARDDVAEAAGVDGGELESWLR